MGVAIRFKVPYKVTAKAHELKSLKPVTNAFYYKAAASAGAAPAYGAPCVGPSDTQTFASSFITAFANIRDLLSVHYIMDEVQVQAIIGKKYKSPVSGVAALISTPLGINVATGIPHGFTTGDLVNIFGVNTPAAANGVWSVAVINSTLFSLAGSVSFATWSGDGFWQEASGDLELLYADNTIVTTALTGGVAGDALPLFSSASVRRLNTGTGRNFRSRLSFSPMAEADNEDGAWETATKTAWSTGLAAFLAAVVDNGSTDAGQAVMLDLVVSPTIALGLATPFAQSDSWTSLITSMALQRNSGSVVKRKPRLTAPIAVAP